MSSQDAAPAAAKHSKLTILTLRRHRDGVWIRRLVEALQEEITTKTSPHHPVNILEVVVLEELLKGPMCITNNTLVDDISGWVGLVNRVSDAAEPWEVKACMAVLQLAKLVGVPIWNSPEAYSLFTHKWCHHILFQRAKLHAPATVMSLQQQPPPAQQQQQQQLQQGQYGQGDRPTFEEQQAVGILSEMERELTVNTFQGLEATGMDGKSTLELLVKPNAGGFGAGIERRTFDRNTRMVNTPSSNSTISRNLPSYSDHFLLFQRYHPPLDGRIYRVWFLSGKVQCGVIRSGNPQDSHLQNNNDFTSGCVGGVCQHRPKTKDSTYQQPSSTTILPWLVPNKVREEIEEQLLPVLPSDAHCGSVEFLYTASNTTQRLYFDLNLLSTLPVDNTQVASASDEDPWNHLASEILRFCKSYEQ
ncbi:hypothetical protein IV203_011787 [Nitzschia inconspicua]|uniref:Uncharacterized protein n=1 Tax=Nitzschia inconspicua TaxID=303405 RepID=A0A9K3KSR0_9STRA|nr:hypothetical protein IV203_011787 [Nitzschia inconspicua]